MRVVMFYHSLVSDWNNGNAHFLRGVVTELKARGHTVDVYEPAGGWSCENLLKTAGRRAFREFVDYYPHLSSRFYDEQTLDPDRVLDDADLVIVHEWNRPELIRMLGRHRQKTNRYRLLFHDTHHRSVSEPHVIDSFNIPAYDGVLAFGKVIRDIYLRSGWTRRAWIWHEAADTRVFAPQPATEPTDDIVWVGNWGDDERSAQLLEFLVDPVRKLHLRANLYGVRYPDTARRLLAESGIPYHGWLANYRVPAVFARHRVTVHIPRNPYTRMLPGIPTIRPFEALACGIPLVCSPWQDTEQLFTAGEDFLTAENGLQMKKQLSRLLNDPPFAKELARRGRHTVLERHTCRHRVDELLGICEQIGIETGLESKDRMTV